MRHETANRIGYIISCFIVVPILLIASIFTPDKSEEEAPENTEDDAIN